MGEKFYENCIRFSKSNPDMKIIYHTALISLAHQEQFFQFDNREFFRMVASAASVLKRVRMPSEHIFYLNNAEFLLIFPTTDFEGYDRINQQTVDELSKIHFRNHGSAHQAQFILESIVVKKNNVSKYPTLDILIHYLRRKLETHIIRE
ncbi:MAG: hypothetical protein ABF913_08235, partial [Oenococcus sp.]